MFACLTHNLKKAFLVAFSVLICYFGFGFKIFCKSKKLAFDAPANEYILAISKIQIPLLDVCFVKIS